MIMKLRKDMFASLLDGSKKSTSRLGHRDVKVGDKLVFEMTEDAATRYETVVTGIATCAFSDLTEEEAKLEGYESLLELKETLKQIYNPNETDVFTLIHFK